MKEIRRDSSKDQSSKNDSFKISTNENFYRSSNKFNSSQINFSKKELYGTLIQNIKLDIQNLQNSINEYSDILIFFKSPKTLSLLPQLVSNKIKEIDASKSQDINSVIESISMDSQNVEKVADNYSCKSHSDLVTKLALQVNLYDCFIKKLNDLSFLLNLRYNNEKNNFSESVYQDSFSRYNLLKGVIEKFINLISSPSQNLSSTKISKSKLSKECYFFEITGANKNRSKYESMMITQVEKKEDDKLLTIKSIDELMSLKDDNGVIKNLKKIISESFDKLNENLKSICEVYGDTNHSKSFHSNNIYEKLIKNQEDVEHIIKSKNQQIVQLNGKLEEIDHYSNNNMEKKQNDKIENNRFDDLLREKDDKIKSLLAIIEENNKTIMNIKTMDEKLKSSLYEDIKDLTCKNSDLSDKYYLLINEHKTLKNSFESLSKTIKKGVDIESYEQLLQEQFDEMKKSFMKKIEILNNTITDMKINTRRKIHDLEEELKQNIYIKDVFLKQITELKKHKI